MGVGEKIEDTGKPVMFLRYEGHENDPARDIDLRWIVNLNRTYVVPVLVKPERPRITANFNLHNDEHPPSFYCSTDSDKHHDEKGLRNRTESIYIYQ